MSGEWEYDPEGIIDLDAIREEKLPIKYENFSHIPWESVNPVRYNFQYQAVIPENWIGRVRVDNEALSVPTQNPVIHPDEHNSPRGESNLQRMYKDKRLETLYLKTSLEPQTQSLYAGTISLSFDPHSHRYTLYQGDEKIRVPSVTTILGVIDKSGPLMGWAIKNTNAVWEGAIQPDTPYSDTYLEQVKNVAKRASREIKGEAADVGKQAHQAIENHLRGENYLLPPKDIPVGRCVDAALQWMSTCSFQPREMERVVFSRKHGYSGTLDCIAEINGEVALVDWKSSKACYPEYFLQTAAYQAAYQEETGEKISRRYLVRLGKEDGSFEVHENYTLKDYKFHLKAFLAALTLYKSLKEMGK